MAATEATTTVSRNTINVRRAMQYIWMLNINWLLKIAELSVPKRFSRVETTPFIDPRQFEWHEVITSQWTTIQSELKAVLSVGGIPRWEEIIEESKALADENQWLTYIFYVFGERFEKQCSECPETMRILHEIPGMKTAFFSILSPGKRLPPHRGPYRGVMRYHLGLIVPQGELGIRVGDQTARWEEGVGMMFDDTYEHEAWNETNETRAVLWLDIVRPMKFPFNIVNSVIIKMIGSSPTVRRMKKKQQVWDLAIESRANTLSRQN